MEKYKKPNLTHKDKTQQQKAAQRINIQSLCHQLRWNSFRVTFQQ